MKSSIIFMLCVFSLHMNGQEMKGPEFDGHKWEAPYNLSIPKDWTIERFLIPIGFAPQISYKGVEDIRFAPGWSNVNSDEYWTYAFLWYLDGSPKTDAQIIANNLKAYYTGLIETNREGFKVPVEKVIPVQASFKETETKSGDLNTYSGIIEMLDYMQQKPIRLNCIVHLKFCLEEKKTILFYELSPKALTHGNWLNLNKLWEEFECKKNDAVK